MDQIAIIQSSLGYEPSTGLFVWQERPLSQFLTENHYKIWHSRFVGKPAFTTKAKGGYLSGRINSKTMMAHNVAWIWVYGAYPVHRLDHINRDRSDNRIENLRDVPHSENMKNAGISSANTSGRTGVSFNAAAGKWIASIKVDGVQRHLGRFSEIEPAIHARISAERKFGFCSDGKSA
jgi:hypothetical protein